VAPSEEDDRDEVRERILAAAAELIDEGGRAAATTRAVATAAAVQAPTLYRLFGDKQGLLDAVAEHVMATYVAKKARRRPHADPVEDLRRGWDGHVEFSLAHPAIFAIMSEVRPGEVSPAAAAGLAVLRARVQRVAAAGRLNVPEERAVALVHSVAVGVIQTLLEQPEDERDLGLSRAARESVLGSITGEPAVTRGSGAHGAAIALRASLAQVRVLSRGERLLLEELLARIAAAEPCAETRR
jgi:AcrR family transcriptional regulator